MSTPLDQLVEVTITQESAAIPQPSFSVALILGFSNRFSGPTVIKYYTDPSQMLADGFQNTDPEYIRAVELTEQAVVPTEFAVGKASAAVAQTETLTIPGPINTGDIFSVTINGTTVSYTAAPSDTADIVLSALSTAINANQGLNVKGIHNPGPHNLVLTAYNWTIQTSSLTQGANWPGEGFSITVTANITDTPGATNHSPVQDLQAIQVVNQGFYCIILCSANWYDILTMAAYVESQTLLYIATSADAEVIDSNATHDVLSQLQGKSYKRTGLLYSAEASSGPDAGWAGSNLPLTPGSSTWAFSTIVGIDPDNLNANQRQTVIGVPGIPGKNGNIYTTVGGVNIVQQGIAAGGQYLDITVGIDWLKAQIQTNIYSLIVQERQAGSKIPYTNQGTSQIIQQVRAAIDLGVSNGLIDGTSPISVTAPDVLSVPANQRANRIAPTVKFSCRLAGAFQTIVVNGVVSV